MVECGRGLRLRSPSEVACGGAAEHFEGSGPIRSNFTPTRPRKAMTRKSFDLGLRHFSRAARPVEQSKLRPLSLSNPNQCQPSGERVLPCNAKRVTGLKTANWRCENFGIYLCAGGQPHCVLSKHVGSLAAGSADVALIWTMKICASSHFTGRSFGEYAFYELI